MARIILGSILLLADLASIFTSPLTVDISNSARASGEIIGYYMFKFGFAAFCIWLIYSGFKKRNKSS